MNHQNGLRKCAFSSPSSPISNLSFGTGPTNTPSAGNHMGRGTGSASFHRQAAQLWSCSRV